MALRTVTSTVVPLLMAAWPSTVSRTALRSDWRVGMTGRGVKKGIAISFCSKDERERLEEIQQFLNKKIEVIKIGIDEYAQTINTAEKKNDIQALIEDHEAWLKSKKRKKTRTGK